MHVGNYIVRCNLNGSVALERRFNSLAMAEASQKTLVTNGSSIILEDARQHITFDSVELIVTETVYPSIIRRATA